MKKLSRLVDFFFRNSKTRDVKFVVKLYECYVLPLLDHCCQLYLPYTAKNVELIESIQNVFTKHLCGQQLPYLNYVNELKHFHLKILESRKILFDLFLLYKLIYGFAFECSLYHFNLISFDTHGNSSKIDTKQLNSGTRRHY